MEITRNTTGMVGGLNAQVDANGHQWCVVVVKGTYMTTATGQLQLAPEQRPLVEFDEHYGDPETTPVRYENDFALYKPLTDVIVVGQAVAAGGQPVTEMRVRLEVDGATKEAVVIGERCWVYVPGGTIASPPVPFTEMPLRFDRAFGGIDTPRGPGSEQAERRNLIGTGFLARSGGARVDEVKLPNLEDPRDRIRTPSSRPAPIGFGHVGRAWLPRLSFAGTYDEAWRRTRRPFFPVDFDPRFFQSAPPDQQFPHFRGGELIRCYGMADAPLVQYVIPEVSIPMRAVFSNRTEALLPLLDTVVLEPHDGSIMLTWRARIRMPRRTGELRGVWVGPPKAGEPVDYRDGRPVFARLADATAWLGQRRKAREEDDA